MAEQANNNQSSSERFSRGEERKNLIISKVQRGVSDRVRLGLESQPGFRLNRTSWRRDHAWSIQTFDSGSYLEVCHTESGSNDLNTEASVGKIFQE